MCTQCVMSITKFTTKKNKPYIFQYIQSWSAAGFIYQASCQSKFFVTFFLSKHKSVTCMDSNSDGFVHQKDNNSVTFMFMNAFSVSCVLLTNVLLFNLRFSILPFGGTLIHFCGCKTDKATNLSFPFTIVSAYTGDLWWLWPARALPHSEYLFFSFFFFFKIFGCLASYEW